MAYIFNTFGLPDLLALIIIFLPILIFISLYINFPFMFTLGKSSFPKFSWIFSFLLLIVLTFGGLGASSVYFVQRYAGSLPSYKSVWSAIDYSYGLYFLVFVVSTPVFYGFYRAWLFINKKDIQSKISQVVVFALALIIPGALFIFIIKIWIANVSNKDFPLSFSQLMNRIGVAIGVDASFVSLIPLLTVLLPIIQIYLEIRSQVKEQEKEKETELENAQSLPVQRNTFKDRDIFSLENADEFRQSFEEEDVEEQPLPKKRTSMASRKLPYALDKKDELHPVDETQDGK